jgi:hydroxymethylglutaryl-CoA reductase (NADPH)
MPTHLKRVRAYIESLFAHRAQEELEELLLPTEDEISPSLNDISRISEEHVQGRWALLERVSDNPIDAVREELLDERTRARMDVYSGNIENFIGTTEVPVGIAGPLRVRGLFARGDYYVPLATSEAVLVASYARGAQAISASGGCTALLAGEGIARAPVFSFVNLIDAGNFIVWLSEQEDRLKEVAQSTTRYGKLMDIDVHLEGNHVYLYLDYVTGDAAGQNMVTIATQAVCEDIAERTPVEPTGWVVEGNFSGDKKASYLSFQGVRGKKVSAEVVIPEAVLNERLKCTAGQLLDYYRVSSIGGVMSGNIGLQGHYANALAAIYLACGQDVACVAESAVGVTRFEPAEGNGLYACVTLPNIIVGTVGGGTRLPAARAGLALLGLAGEHSAKAFAEIVAATVLAGELSITAALVSRDFTSAHQRLARDRAMPGD